MTQEAFIHIANEMRARAVGVALRFGYAQDDAEDIAQDVMLKLWCLRGEIDDAARLKASVAIATRHVCIDHWRTARLNSNMDAETHLVDEDSLYDRLEYAELEQWMDEQIKHLPSTSRIVLTMRQLEHCELSEIAAILGIKQRSVSTYLQKEMGYSGRLNYMVTLPQDSFDITPYTEEMLAADIDSLFRQHRIKPRKALWQHDQEYSKAYWESIMHTGDRLYCRGGGDLNNLGGVTNATIYTVPLNHAQLARQLLASFDSLAQQYTRHLHREAHYVYRYYTTFKEPIWAPLLTITSMGIQSESTFKYTCDLDLKRDEFGYHFVVAQTQGTLWMPHHWPSVKRDINGQRTYFKGMRPKEEKKEK